MLLETPRRGMAMRPSDTRAAVCSTQGNFFCFFFLLFVPRPLTSGVVRAPPPPATGDRNPGNGIGWFPKFVFFPVAPSFKWSVFTFFIIYFYFITIYLFFIQWYHYHRRRGFFLRIALVGKPFRWLAQGWTPPTPIRPSCTALPGSVVQAADPRTTHIEPLHVV